MGQNSFFNCQDRKGEIHFNTIMKWNKNQWRWISESDLSASEALWRKPDKAKRRVAERDSSLSSFWIDTRGKLEVMTLWKPCWLRSLQHLSQSRHMFPTAQRHWTCRGSLHVQANYHTLTFKWFIFRISPSLLHFSGILLSWRKDFLDPKQNKLKER